MNYYERIQQSANYIESNLNNMIDINSAAEAAYMSVSTFYRLFFALTGYSVGSIDSFLPLYGFIAVTNFIIC